jgi:hypothetical protein
MDLKLKKVNIMINIFFQKPDFHTGSKNKIIEPKVYYKKYRVLPIRFGTDEF